MKLLTRKKLCAVGLAAATVPALVLLSSSAQADPSPNNPRVLAGMGSDTTQELMNALGESITVGGTKVLASYNAQGAAITSTNPSDASCSYTGNVSPVVANGPGVRANGSGAGRDRLVESLTAGSTKEGCLDFARSSSLNLAAVPAGTGGLTYVPLALDAVTYATRSDATIPKTLTKAQLKSIFECTTGTSNFLPVLPQASSGTRSFFLSTIGVSAPGACVLNGVTAGGAVIEENDGRVLSDKKMIVPFSVAQFTAQSAGVQTSVLGAATLGSIDGQPSQTISPNAAGLRTVYNVIPTSKISDPTVNEVFVGTSSKVCTSSPVITRNGFAPTANCGSTAQATP
jgi:ABC-type phosphate transport system substrate-binding protein